MPEIYKETFVTMQSWFIFVCFAEFLLFAILSVRAACNYLPIFNSQSISILTAFLMSYLVQAALFLRIRKRLGNEELSNENNQLYELYLRYITILHFAIYLLFFMIWFRIEAVYLQSRRASWAKIEATKKQSNQFAVAYVILIGI